MYRQQENGFMRHNQNRRSRGRSNNNRKGPNPLTRSYESNGPDVKVRGTAMHIAEKYTSLARDAQSAGDIVAVENYLQHAEHYNRIVMAAQAQLQQSQPAPFRDNAEEGDDEDRQMNGRFRDRFEFNGEGARPGDDGEERFEAGEDQSEERNFQPRQPRPDERPRGQDDRRGPRPERFDRRPDRGERGDRPEQRFEPRGERGDRPEQRFEPRGDRGGDRPDRGDRPYRGEPPERFDRPVETVGEAPAEREAPLRPQTQEGAPAPAGRASEAPQALEAVIPGADEAPAPRRRRGRPPRAENGAVAETVPEDATPDGAAALAAFPD
jgi:hypothetical protein